MSGDINQEHKDFVKTITRLLESGEIDVTKPESFLNKAVYDSLDHEWNALPKMTPEAPKENNETQMLAEIAKLSPRE